MKFFAIILGLTLGICSVSAQDILYYKTGKTKEVHITEFGLNEVKFILPNVERQIVYSVSKVDLSRVVFEDGTIEVIIDELANPDLYLDNRKLALKFNFVSPLLGNTVFALEKNIRPGLSMEYALNIIGLGSDINDRKSSGLGFRIGPKYIFMSDYKIDGQRYSHVLQGLYLRPELVVGFYNEKLYQYENSRGTYSYGQTKPSNTRYGMFFVSLGKQYVFNNRFLTDFYMGVGYGLANTNGNNNEYHHYGFFGESKSLSLGVTGGFRIGILLNQKNN